MSDTVAIKELQNRKVLEFIGNTVGPVAVFAFGIALWTYSASENLFTFAAWGMLDFLTGVSMYKAGAKKESVLPLLYGLICVFVVAMIFRNGEWVWTNVETIAFIGTAVALVCWWRLGPSAGVVAFGAALAIASVPIVIGTYHNPQPWEWWMWVGSGVSSTIGLYLTRPWSLENIADWLFVAISAVVGNLILLLLVRPLFF